MTKTVSIPLDRLSGLNYDASSSWNQSKAIKKFNEGK